MYMILKWGKKTKRVSGKFVYDSDYVDCIKNKDGSIRLFEGIQETDTFANNRADSDDLRVISIEGVEE